MFIVDLRYGWIVIAIDLLAIGLSLWKLNKNKTSSNALRTGAFLLIVGLVLSLLSNLFRENLRPITDQLVTYLSNFSLITAGVGANLIASSMLITDPPASGKVASGGGAGTSGVGQITNQPPTPLQSPAVAPGTQSIPAIQTPSPASGRP